MIDKEPPYVSDDFQIGPNGAYEALEVPCSFCEGTIDLAKEDTCSQCGKSHFLDPDSWDNIFDDYKGEQNMMQFVVWLKENYQVPTKIVKFVKDDRNKI